MELVAVHIGMLIEQRMNELGLSKSEFARRCGVVSQHVNRILESQSINTDRLIVVSKALDYNFFECFRVVGDSGRAKVISADNGSIAAGGDVNGGTSMGSGSTINNYAGCNEGEQSEIVRTLTESVSTLTRELEMSQKQKSNLIAIIGELIRK